MYVDTKQASKQAKRIIAFILAFLMVFSSIPLVPLTVLAQTIANELNESPSSEQEENPDESFPIEEEDSYENKYIEEGGDYNEQGEDYEDDILLYEEEYEDEGIFGDLPETVPINVPSYSFSSNLVFPYVRQISIGSNVSIPIEINVNTSDNFQDTITITEYALQ
ncbi:MAG: hypothetical protein FWF57_07620 [Defluviitaleaceae bacterium]|nr:hypothetical protein [Defluviitaleaceae bacterium]